MSRAKAVVEELPQAEAAQDDDGIRRCARVTIRPADEGEAEIQLVPEGKRDTMWLRLTPQQQRYLRVNLELLDEARVPAVE